MPSRPRPRRIRTLAAVVVAVAAAPRAARADVARLESSALAPFGMPRLAHEAEARLAVDYLGAIAAPGEVHGVSLRLGYARPVSARLVVGADAGLMWAERGPTQGWSLANVTVGGRYRLGVSGRRTTAVRAAVTAPLAADDGDAAIPGEVHGGLRVADGERFAAGTTSILLGGIVRYVRPKAFAQVEAAGQGRVRLDAPDELWLRVGLAGGVAVVPRVALVGELTTVSGILSGGLGDGDAREDFRHTLDLGLRVDVPRAVIGVRLQVPLDAALRDQDVFVAGVDATLSL